MEMLQQFEHRSIVVLEEAPRDVNLVVGRDSDEALVERAVMDRTHAQAVGDYRLAVLLEITGDMSSVE
jgi:hypothetical protein